MAIRRHNDAQLELLYEAYLEVGINLLKPAANDSDQENVAPTESRLSVVETETPPQLTPNKQLWTDDVILNFVKNFLKASLYSVGSPFAGQFTRSEAREWLLSDDTDNPLSFLNCCTMLGYDDPDALRSRTILTAKQMKTRDW
ncbi:MULTISPECIES: hypothetical protein [Halomonas]|uniref:hypothetical protein n=1 Tax=Halomonas TaxID=2745 RepID=UPI00186725B5|nr:MULTISPECIES: hypothetical protein [Halomonas]